MLEALGALFDELLVVPPLLEDRLDDDVEQGNVRPGFELEVDVAVPRGLVRMGIDLNDLGVL